MLAAGRGAPMTREALAGLLVSAAVAVPPPVAGDLAIINWSIFEANPICKRVDPEREAQLGPISAAQCTRWMFPKVLPPATVQHKWLLRSPVVDIELVGKKFKVRIKDRAVRVAQR